jgi:diadenosine tetraphosphate (Ap4A) HIT family hydrolase
MAHATLEKFGYPATLIREYAHWCVLARPQQATLGALVLGSKSGAASFAGLEAEAYGELAVVTRHIETALAAFRPFDRINYLMLMMVDPHVHFHVLPRYAGPQTFADRTFEDTGWPLVPNLAGGIKADAELLAELTGALKGAWPA